MDATPNRNDRITLAMAWGVAVFLLVIPLVVTPDLIDRFRVVKESFARAEGILGGFALAVAIAFAGLARFREMLRERQVVAVVAAGASWVVATTLLSTHRAHSVDSLITFLTSVLVFAAAWYAAPRISLLIVDLLVAVVLLNAVLLALQEYGIYQPFRTNPLTPHHMTATALLGNPNIVGTYMALVAVIFAAAAARCPGARRWWLAFGALCAAAGVLVSQTLTAVVALMAGLLMLAIGRSAKRATFMIAAAIALFAIGVVLKSPPFMRLLRLSDTIDRRGLNFATSGRVLPAFVGLEMARDHPIAGVGPGTFKYHYMPYAVRVLGKTGQLPPGIASVNFGEAHNDHVQVMAETGIPGYILFLGTVIVLVKAVRRTEGRNLREGVAREVVLPLAGALLVLCVAQFPLYVPVTRHLVVTMAGLLIGWSRTPE